MEQKTYAECRAIDQLSIGELKQWMVDRKLMAADQSLEDLNVLFAIADRLRAEIVKIQDQGRKGWQDGDLFELFGLRLEALGEKTKDGAQWATTYHAIGQAFEDHYWHELERIGVYQASARAVTRWEAIARATAKAFVVLVAHQ
jgi:hypothetical protein